MKIKFIDPAYANFEGMFGHIEFKEGVSVHDVSVADVRLYGAIASIEVIGEHVAEASYEDMKDVAAVSVNLPTLAQLQRAAAEAAHSLMAPPEPVSAPEVKRHTREELEAVADKSGLAGLRAIAEPMGLRANSIGKLIAAILKAQTPEAAPAAFIAAPAEAVTVAIHNSEDGAE